VIATKWCGLVRMAAGNAYYGSSHSGCDLRRSEGYA